MAGIEPALQSYQDRGLPLSDTGLSDKLPEPGDQEEDKDCDPDPTPERHPDDHARGSLVRLLRLLPRFSSVFEFFDLSEDVVFPTHTIILSIFGAR